jgi:hypothetical protein
MLGRELKQTLDNRERSAKHVVLANEAFCLKPHVFNRVLLRGIRRKSQTGDAPLVRIESLIYLFEKGFDFLRAVIAGSIPQ